MKQATKSPQVKTKVMQSRASIIFSTISLVLVSFLASLLLVSLLPVTYVAHDTPQAARVVVEYLWGQSSLVQLTERAEQIAHTESYPSREFTPKEAIHMQDVKVLFGIATILCGFCLGVLITQYPAIHTQAAFIITCASVTLLALFGMFAFDKAFALFHEVLFTNDHWLLPYTSYLITTFPQAFFQNMAITIGGLSVLISALTHLFLSRIRKNGIEMTPRSH